MRGLVIRQHALSLEGTVGAHAEARGARLVRHVPGGDGTLPPLEGFDFVVAMGAPWSVYGPEVESWIEEELELFRKAVAERIPVFGVCFGAQAFAQALGGRVQRATQPELGWATVESLAPAIVEEGPWFMWHGDTLTLPHGSRLLARTETGPQAYAFGPHLLVQFHPEITPDILDAWCATDDSDFRRYGVDKEAVIEETRRRREEAAERARRLFERFLGGVAREQSRRGG